MVVFCFPKKKIEKRKTKFIDVQHMFIEIVNLLIYMFINCFYEYILNINKLGFPFLFYYVQLRPFFL